MSVNGPISLKQCDYEISYSFYSFYWRDSLEIRLDHNSTYYRSLSEISEVKHRISQCDSQNLQYKTHPEFWPSHRQIFKSSLYYKTRLILETQRYYCLLFNPFSFMVAGAPSNCNTLMSLFQIPVALHWRCTLHRPGGKNCSSTTPSPGSGDLWPYACQYSPCPWCTSHLPVSVMACLQHGMTVLLVFRSSWSFLGNTTILKPNLIMQEYQ